jgi:carbonic anhydrase/acetyltransferase-like protein (isoleucine patch superfamily)
MPIYAVDDREPTIDPEAFVHPDAVIIGRVTIGAGSTVWPGAVLRGDYGAIEVGRATSVQDGTVIHATAALDTIIGSEVVIGHLVHLEGCVIEDGALVGSGSVVLHRARVGSRATVGAGAVVTNGMQIPADALAVGTPATIKEGRSNPDFIKMAVAVYLENGERYRRSLRRLD